MASNMNDMIMAYAYLFSDSNELEIWAEDMGIIHFPEIQVRLSELRYMEEDEMDIDDWDKVIDNHIRSFNKEEELMEWCEQNNFTEHRLVKKLLKEMEDKSDKRHRCDNCNKRYLKKSSLEMHMRSVHEKKLFNCWKCEKVFRYNSSRLRHEKVCCGATLTLRNYECSHCKAKFPTTSQLIKHNRIHRINECAGIQNNRDHDMETSPQPGPSGLQSRSFTCRTCNCVFPNRRDLYLDQMRHIQEGTGLKLQTAPWVDNTAPWIDEHGEIDEKLKEVYEANRPFILEENQERMVTSRYNVPVGTNFSIEHLIRNTEEITRKEDQTFRINFAFGIILRNIETGNYRYFRPYGNETVFEQPLLINKRKDINAKLRLRLEKIELTEYLLRQRENSKWKPVMITNVHVMIYRTNFPLGAGKTELPPYLTRKSCLIGLTTNKQGVYYEDNLCVFRCLATHLKSTKFESSVKEYYAKWVKYMYENDMGDFTAIKPQAYTGIHLQDISEFEKCFEINVNIYSLDEDEIVKLIHVSRCRYRDNMMLNLYQSHLSYIRDNKTFSQKFGCEHCEKNFKTSYQCIRHRRTCREKTTFCFPGGFYKLYDTIFDNLEELGFSVSKDNSYFPWYIVYDFEAMLKPLTELEGSEKLTWTKVHKPISVSVCTNVDGFREPKCFIDSDLDNLLSCMVKYMEEIAAEVKKLAEERWSESITLIKQRLVGESNKIMINIYKQTLSKLNEYCQQTPVLGFNSSKYDLNLIKQKIAKHLRLHDKEQKSFVVKQNNSYSCISTKTLKFLDISKYLAPGCSYAKFLRAYGVEEQKGYFPYEWFDKEDKLNYSSLPSHEDFFSALKNKNISSEEYEFCQRIWKEKNMKTFREFLVWYNNLDVKPFITAVQNLQKFYFDKGIDIFKSSISVPGIARRMLFQAGSKFGAHFSLFHKEDADLYHTIQNNIVGGPSIIFNRHCEVGNSFIRDNPKKVCKKIVGFDANALYLWGINQKMPVGTYIRRRKENLASPADWFQSDNCVAAKLV